MYKDGIGGDKFSKKYIFFETETSNERVIIGTYMERVWLLQLLRVQNDVT